MNNEQYYIARDLGLCPDCGQHAAPFVYCADHREARRVKIQAERVADRAGYNQYMRVYLGVRRQQR